jgi:nitroreductase
MFECIRECVQKSRSIRRFREEGKVSRETLLELVDIARFCPSARNRQPLRYIISCEPEKTEKICDCLLWARDLPAWNGPCNGERSPAYITIVTEIDGVQDPRFDAGIAAQTIMLAAAAKDLGGCIIGSIDKKRLAGIIALPKGYDIQLVLAIGYPAEQVVLESIPADGDTRYWQDEQGIHHVPKRALQDIVLEPSGSLRKVSL